MTSYGVRRFFEAVEVAKAVPLLESGYTQRNVAERFDVSRSVVPGYQETGEFTRREGQGRHRMTSQRKDQYLRSEGCKSISSMQLVKGYLIKQYVTGYMKAI